MPTSLPTLARWLVIAGLVLIVLGAAVWLLSKTGLPLGRLPGDLHWKSENVEVYVPIATMIVLSLLLTVLANVILRWWR